MATFKVDKPTAINARAIMDNTFVPFKIKDRMIFDIATMLANNGYPLTSRWVMSCYNMPSIHGLKMSCLNELLGTYGVEFVNLEPDNYHCPKGIEYLNMGDHYTPTLLFFDSRYSIGCWGDVLEQWENKHGMIGV